MFWKFIEHPINVLKIMSSVQTLLLSARRLRVRINHMIMDGVLIIVEKFHLKNISRPHLKRKAVVFKFLPFEERFRKAPCW